MMQPSRMVASGAMLALGFFALAAGAEMPALNAAPAEPLRIRWRTEFATIGQPYEDARKFQAAHPHLAVEFKESYPADQAHELENARSLIEGELDVAGMAGPIFAPRKTTDEPGARCDQLLDLLARAKCEFSVVARQAMAVVVHPQNPLREIDEATAEQILQGKITSWQSLGQDDRSIKLVSDFRIHRVTERLGAIGRGMRFNERESAKGPETVARDRWVMGFLDVDRHLAGSGLKILPVRPREGGAALLPSPQNVISGRYPFYAYLVAAARPDAPPLTQEFRKSLRPESYWRSQLDYTLSGDAVEEVWPLPDPRIATPAVSGAVAVLPLEPLSKYFLMTDSSYHAAYEEAVAAGIARDGRLKLVDRAALARVLSEHKLGLLAAGQRPRRPLVAADVLVLSFVISDQSRAYLLIEAIHAATTSVLGRLKLPIDPARPAEFPIPLAERVAQWWPGVLRNLDAVRRRPVWMLLPIAGVEANDYPRVEQFRAACQSRLAADSAIFLTNHTMLMDAQREVLMELMGISRPAGGKFTPAADYLVDLQFLAGKVRLRVLRGSDLANIREAAIVASDSGAAAKAEDWLSEQVASLSARQPARAALSPPVTAPNAAQATLELERGGKFRQEHEALQDKYYQQHHGLENFTPQEIEELHRLDTEANRCFQRAAQLDPSRESAAYEAAKSLFVHEHGTFAAYCRAAEAAGRFVETFPDSKYREEMLHDAAMDCMLSAYHVDVPGNLGPEAICQQYRRKAIFYTAQYLAISRPGPDAMMQHYCSMMMEQYEARASEEEVGQMLCQYGLAVDGQPACILSSDFQRLKYLAKKQKKQAYAALLTAMQRRWPDPADVHWKLGKDLALDDLCELFQTDPRGTSFYRWLRGKRGIGDLP